MGSENMDHFAAIWPSMVIKQARNINNERKIHEKKRVCPRLMGNLGGNDEA